MTDTAVKKSAESVKMPENGKKKHLSWQVIACVCLVAVSVVLNVVAWKSTAFCDWYTAHVFPIWENTYGRLTSLLPFSFGELLIAVAVFGIPLSLVAMLVLVIVRKGKRKKTAKIFGLVYMWIVTFVVTVQTFNCFVIYHCSSFAELNGILTEQHTRTELEALGNKLVTEINALSKEVERDSEGKFVLTADLDKTAQEAMRGLGSEFKNLGGFYVTPKAIKCSFFMSQMDLMGIYFPFSMEANYNQDMYKAKLPDTVCHELAHTKGYIQEDEANFIAFMACDRSDNADYRYSGYLAALGEVRNKIFDYASDDKKIEFDSSICDEVWADMEANWDYWRSVDEAKDTVFDSEAVGEISDKAMEKSLKLNGVEDGKQSYGRMVDLMLNYFKSKGEL